MMGSGKTTVGRALAELAVRDFADTDTLLQQRFGRPISQIFQIYGEPTFRDHEGSVLRSLEPASRVLSTGGGIVLREANWAEMDRLGTTVYLRASLETLLERLERGRKRRPLLDEENWEGRVQELLAARQSLYERAELIVDVDGQEIEDVAQWLMTELISR